MFSRGWHGGVSDEAANLAKAARALKAQSRWPRSNLPTLWFLTDETRTLDPVAVARALPPGAGIVLRHYRDCGRARLAKELALVARANSLTLLIGADARLAREVGAHGVHLPRWARRRSGRGQHFGLTTYSVHVFIDVVWAATSGANTVFLSPVFRTESHPGARPLGAVRFSALARLSPCPVIALGGITGANVSRLKGSGTYGIGAIGALLPSTD